jgi:hypothetical protein
MELLNLIADMDGYSSMTSTTHLGILISAPAGKGEQGEEKIHTYGGGRVPPLLQNSRVYVLGFFNNKSDTFIKLIAAKDKPFSCGNLALVACCSVKLTILYRHS